MEKWLKWAVKIQSLAQAGLAYTDNVYDIERYKRLREISAEMIEEKSNISLDKVKKLFCNETLWLKVEDLIDIIKEHGNQVNVVEL